MKKKRLGQFYTTNSKYITQGLLNVFPKTATVIDPFAGECDLVSLISNKVELYDIDPRTEDIVRRDTLISPIDYTGKWIFTNPPYLARNKNEDKTIYNLYETDDLYKASLLSIIGCEGGVIIVPLNFFSADDGKMRKSFLSKYEVKQVNVFEEQVFEDTTYTICAFSFIKKDNENQTINFKFFPNNKELSISLSVIDGYRIGSEIYTLPQSSVKVGRLLEGQEPSSMLFLNTIDTGSPSGVISLSVKQEPYFGKRTDRSFATISFDKVFTLEEELLIAKEFNLMLTEYREKYNSMFLSNYRNSTTHMARKRIGFKLAYQIISFIILKKLSS